jgi:hypothetical protein
MNGDKDVNEESAAVLKQDQRAAGGYLRSISSMR